MYENYERLLLERGETSYRVAKETGLSETLFSNWKSGSTTPKVESLIKIADHFGVTLDDLCKRSDEN